MTKKNHSALLALLLFGASDALTIRAKIQGTGSGSQDGPAAATRPVTHGSKRREGSGGQNGDDGSVVVKGPKPPRAKESDAEGGNSDDDWTRSTGFRDGKNDDLDREAELTRSMRKDTEKLQGLQSASSPVARYAQENAAHRFHGTVEGEEAQARLRDVRDRIGVFREDGRALSTSSSNSYTSLNPDVERELLSDYDADFSNDDDNGSEFEHSSHEDEYFVDVEPPQGWFSYLLGGFIPTCGAVSPGPPRDSGRQLEFDRSGEMPASVLFSNVDEGSAEYGSHVSETMSGEQMQRIRRRSMVQQVVQEPDSWWNWRMPDIMCGNTREDGAVFLNSSPPGPGQEQYPGETDDLLANFVSRPENLPTTTGETCQCCFEYLTFREAPDWVFRKIPEHVRRRMPRPYVCQLCHDKFAAKNPSGRAIRPSLSIDTGVDEPSPRGNQPKLIPKSCCLCDKTYDIDKVKYGIWLCTQCTVKADLLPDVKAQVIAKKVQLGGMGGSMTDLKL